MLEKKGKDQGKLLTIVCFEYNFVNTPLNLWGLDSRAIVNVVVSLQGVTNKPRPSEHKAKLKIGNDANVNVKFIGKIS